MSGFTGPKDMESLIEGALESLKSVQKDAKFPHEKIQNCSGIALMHSMELGIGVSAQDASGVLLSYKDGTWSPPLAIAMTSVGVGSLGFAEKQTILVLNQAAIDDVCSSKSLPIKFGADAGLTNAIGGEVGGGTGVGKAGLESCYAFSNSKGGIISLEIHGAVIKPKDDINKEYYHSAVTTADVLQSKVNAPKDSKATELLANVSAITAK